MMEVTQTILTIAAQALDFAPALALNLALIMLTGWVLWFRFGGLIGDMPRQITILTTVALLGLCFIGYLVLGLAMAGWFSAARFFGLWALVLTLLAVDGVRRGRWTAHCIQWRSSRPLSIWFGLLLVLWLFLYVRPFDLVIGGRDPGVYVNVAAQIAEQGGLAVADPFLADLDPAIQDQLMWRPVWYGGQIPFKWPGYFWMDGTSDRTGLVLPQFFHMYSALMVPAYSVLGFRGALTILPIVILVMGFLLAELAWRLLSISRFLATRAGGAVWPPAAVEIGSLLPVLFLLLNPAMYWFGRFANADVPYGMFVFAALFFWVRAADHQEQASLNWSLALLCFGAALLTKIDGFYLLPGVVLIAQRFHPSLGGPGQRARLAVWATVCVLCLAAIAGFSYPYVLWTLRSMGLDSGTTRTVPVLLMAGYLTLVTLAGLIPPLLSADRLERLRMRWRVPAASFPVAAGAASLLSVALLAAVLPNADRLDRALDTSLVYVPWPMLLAGFLGIVWLVWHVRKNVLAVPLLAIFFTSGVFILLQTNSADHPWSERRATSLAVPLLMLFAGVTVFEALSWALRNASTGDAGRKPGVLRRPERYIVVLLVLIAVLVPMARAIPRIFLHHEAAGARGELRLLDSFFPKDAVILSGGSQAMDLFAPGLSAEGGRSILTFYTSSATPVIPTDIIEKVGDAAISAGRSFFFVVAGDDMPPGHFVWERALWGEWSWHQLVGRDAPKPLTPEVWPVRYRVYKAVAVEPVTNAVTPCTPICGAEVS